MTDTEFATKHQVSQTYLSRLTMASNVDTMNKSSLIILKHSEYDELTTLTVSYDIIQ